MASIPPDQETQGDEILVIGKPNRINLPDEPIAFPALPDLSELLPKIDLNLLNTEKAPKTGFNISNFRTELEDSGGGILPTHSYHVAFAPFLGATARDLNNFIISKNEKLVLRADRVNLPGPTLLKQENIRRYGYGPVEQVAYGVQFGELSIQWIVDKKAELVSFFNAWMNLIVNFESKGGGQMIGTNSNGFSPYEIGYKDDYANRQMNIFVYDRSLDQTIIYEIYDLFPIAINDTALSWTDVDQSMKLDIRFAFTDYTIKTPMAGNIADIKATINPLAQNTDGSERKSDNRK